MNAECQHCGHHFDAEPRAKHRLLCGDATKPEDVGRVLDGASPAVVLTDPPYGMGKEIANDAPDEWRSTLKNALSRIPGRPWLFVFCGARADLMRAAMEEVDPKRVLIWHKPFALGYPHDGLAWHFEPCLVRPGDGEPAANIADVIEAAVIFRKDDPENEAHPTQKPAALFDAILRGATPGPVFDPFLGSGTTLVVAERLGRQCAAIELEPRFVDVAVLRWQEFTGKTAFREDRHG